ncbi:putative membrane protein [Maribacter vaceletii]|uniref:Putative membrane protein n=1 Tax=Maribacter vaceletii TaxID=1206816 RepID=A0A495ED56_9FLAO|nr:hypothetical protein [Maribacter vaceletii]RKR14483.1 putative membrane protein [Maribacter vaceletii]
MKPFIVLIVVSILALIFLKINTGDYNYALSARIGMSAMLVFTALGHFMYADGMALMVPDFIPFKKEVIILTGILEALGAFALHFSEFRVLVAWFLILFFITILPSNIKAAVENINYQKGTYDGPGLLYLWFRVPLQICFILWVYLSSIRV